MWSSSTHADQVFLPHEYTSSREEAAAVSLKAGTDINCGEFGRETMANRADYYQEHTTKNICLQRSVKD